MEKYLSTYISNCPDTQKDACLKLIEIISAHLPRGFEKCMSYGMVGRVVPHHLYPDGYHCNPDLPLPFINLAYRKSSINFYHMGIYAMPEVYNWFVQEYPDYSSKKLDMGKSCVRFKWYDDIPYTLIGKLCEKISLEKRIETYEHAIKK